MWTLPARSTVKPWWSIPSYVMQAIQSVTSVLNVPYAMFTTAGMYRTECHNEAPFKYVGPCRGDRCLIASL